MTHHAPKQHGGMPSPRAQNLRVYWLARQIEDCRSAQAADIYSFAKTDLLIRKAAIEHRRTRIGRKAVLFFI